MDGERNQGDDACTDGGRKADVGWFPTHQMRTAVLHVVLYGIDFGFLDTAAGNTMPFRYNGGRRFFDVYAPDDHTNGYRPP